MGTNEEGPVACAGQRSTPARSNRGSVVNTSDGQMHTPSQHGPCPPTCNLVSGFPQTQMQFNCPKMLPSPRHAYTVPKHTLRTLCALTIPDHHFVPTKLDMGAPLHLAGRALRLCSLPFAHPPPQAQRLPGYREEVACTANWHNHVGLLPAKKKFGFVPSFDISLGRGVFCAQISPNTCKTIVG